MFTTEGTENGGALLLLLLLPLPLLLLLLCHRDRGYREVAR